MNINRNNYEEYFLLYIDNELSVAEKNSVDAFIADNPDLGEELVMLQQSILKTDIVAFNEKELLLKPQPADELTEEKLLLLLDGELNEGEKNNILALINTNKAVKEEWELLQQTKLSSADNIVFEQKELLYRKEPKVIAVPWWRMAAAAVLIGAGLWSGSKYFNSDIKEVNAGAETVNALNKEKTHDDTQNTAPVNQQNIGQSKNSTVASTQPTDIKANNIKKHTGNQGSTQQAPLPKQQNNTVAANHPDEAVDNTDPLKEINDNDSNKKIYVSVSPETNITKPESKPVTLSSLKNSLAVNTSLSNGEPQVAYQTFDDDEEEKPKRTKLGGLFKRVKRVLERKAKIKTGSDDEVRIANMSFAMH